MKKFFDSLNAFLNLLDNGKFFRNPMKWLYAIFALLNVAAPIYLFINTVKYLDQIPAWDVIVFLIVWVILLVGFCLLGLFWWLRKDQITEHNETFSEYPATPVFAHFLRTLGEWLGMLTGGVMFLVALATYVLSGFEGGQSMFSSLMPMDADGIVSILMMPVFGFITILFFRFLSEMCRVRLTIAKNTNK